jgi:hypothetical protein
MKNKHYNTVGTLPKHQLPKTLKPNTTTLLEHFQNISYLKHEKQTLHSNIQE